MPVIEKIEAIEILDSRGRPTVLVRMHCAGALVRASVPSGASTGSAEAIELRDAGASRFGGLGCQQAVANINGAINAAAAGRRFESQKNFDEALIALDGTENKSRLGANAIVGASIAFARCLARSRKLELFQSVAKELNRQAAYLPRPTINLFSGGKHAGGQVEIQDVLLVPLATDRMSEALAMAAAVYSAAVDLCREKYGMRPLVADEGGLAPPAQTSEALIADAVESIRRAGLWPGVDIALAVDVASSHFYLDGRYCIGEQPLTSAEMIDMMHDWRQRYPIVSIEDGLAESDWQSWPLLRRRLHGAAITLGDDLLCTNPHRVRRAIQAGAADALLLKVNQIGTITQAVEAMNLARAADWAIVVSARSGETEDDWLADLAVGLGGDFIKIGSIARSERLAKYNRLLEIEHDAGISIRRWEPIA